MGEHVYDVVVIGAGPYGLATGAHLRALGLDVVVLGQTMSSWREAMPAGMLLRSERGTSNISSPDPTTLINNYFNRIPEPFGTDPSRVPIETFISYGTWFSETQIADARSEANVTALSRDPAGTFRLELDSGDTLLARSVVVAMGHRMHTRMPAELDSLGRESELVTHVSEHADLAKFRDRRVAIVGAGQSALETAALLSEYGASPVLLVRNAAVNWDRPPSPKASSRLHSLRRPSSGLGPGWHKKMFETHAEVIRPLPMQLRHYLLREVLGPGGAWWLRERVEPYVETRTDTRVTAAEIAGEQVLLDLATTSAGSTRIEVDHVIAATGYRYELDRVDMIAPALRSQVRTVSGYPQLSSHLESSVPNLYFTGLAAGGTFGPVMRFVCGTPFAAPRVAGSINRRLRNGR
jgi:cation diffusion facilitator CzcD-associated flavoprotein CzcO